VQFCVIIVHEARKFGMEFEKLQLLCHKFQALMPVFLLESQSFS
jgi:hypothetical protein